MTDHFMHDHIDVAIVGGGLSGTLLAWKLARTRPDLKLLLIERGHTLGGNHTWCFHGTDLKAEELLELRPAIKSSWDRHEVRFPKFDRIIESEYFCISSESLHEAVAPLLLGRAIYAKSARITGPNSVELECGTSLRANCVIDARGDARGPGILERSLHSQGWQKFFGMEVTLSEPHSLTHPLLMDGKCDQLEGHRFFYLLPFETHRLLIEDTRYSSSPEVDGAAFESEIRAYAARKGWTIESVERREAGTLPIPFHSSNPREGALAIGMGSGFFHPTTGYSLPDTVRVIGMIASLDNITPDSVRAALETYRSRTESSRKFFRFLNRMLFCSKPESRYKVMQKFYTLRGSLITRFYRGDLRWIDRIRILSGRPPVPILKAIQAIFSGTQQRNSTH